MPIPAGVCRIVLYGTFGTGDIWETGFWMDDTGVTDSATATALALTIGGTLNSADASGAMRVTAANLLDDFSVWIGVRVYVYVTPGPKSTAIGEYVLPTPRVGGKVISKPNQVALCMTLRTALAGRRHRGRMYLPATGVDIDTQDGQVSQANLNTVLTSWVTAFSDINDSDAGRIVVVSTQGSAATPVSSLTIDSKLDIQRRRANRETILRRANGNVTPHPS